MARRCWKHSRQKTGRPWVGRKGTVVSFPHCEQLVLVSARMGEAPPPTASARLALQALHRFGSFLKPLSAKNICSPAVNTNSAPHSEHFKTLSWYSMEASPWTPEWARERADFARRAEKKQQGPAWSRVCNRYNLLISDSVLLVRNPERCQPGNRAGAPGPTSATLQTSKYRSLPDRGLNHGAGRIKRGNEQAASEECEAALEVNPVRAAAFCANASAKALPWPDASRRASCKSYAS